MWPPKYVGVVSTTLLLGVALAAPAEEQAASTRDPAVPVAGGSSRRFVGSKRCRMCHSSVYESWLESAHAPSAPSGTALDGRRGSNPGAFDALLPGMSVATKRKAGLDPHTDYTTNFLCLGCHTVGVGQPGGYDPLEDRADSSDRRRAQARRGVGCESCHGAGSAYVHAMSDLAVRGATCQPQKLHRLGLKTVSIDTCLSCHHTGAPCIVSPVGSDGESTYEVTFGAQVDERRGVHQHVDLKRCTRRGAALVSDRDNAKADSP